MNPPSALHGAMSRERKPFTYTPGGLNLSEIKSERMAKRLMRNAMNQGVPETPAQKIQSPPITSNKAIPNFNCLPVQVFPTFNLPSNPKSLLRTRSHPEQPKEPLQRKVVPPPEVSTNFRPYESDFNRAFNYNNNVKQYSPASNNYNANNNKPASMYEYNRPAATIYDPKTCYGSDGHTIPLLPEKSYDAEYFQVPSQGSRFVENTEIAKERIDIPKNISQIEPRRDVTLDILEKPVINEVSAPIEIEIKPLGETMATDDDQKEVKVVKKQVNQETVTENQNGNANAAVTIKLPGKKTGAKTETKVEIENKILPDGTVEETKTTTTKTTIDGKTEISTKVEKRILSKEEADAVIEVEEEEEEEEEVEESGEEATKEVKEEVKQSVVIETKEVVPAQKEKVQESEENGEEVVEESDKEEPTKNGDKDSIIKQEERQEITTTKKVVVIQSEGDEEEEEIVEEEEEEEEEDVEEVVIKKETQREESAEKEEVAVEIEIKNETKDTNLEKQVAEEEIEEVEEEVEKEAKTESNEESESRAKDEDKEEINDEQNKKENGEDTPVKANEISKDKEEEEEIEEEEEEYEEAEETEVEAKSEIKQESVTVKNEVETKDQDEPEIAEEEPKSKTEEIPIKVIVETKAETPVEIDKPKDETEKPQDVKPTIQPEQKLPLREPSIPLEKVEDVEIKPIGAGNDFFTKSLTQNTEIITSTTDKPLGALSTQTEYNRIENIVTVNRTTKTLDHAYEQMIQPNVPTIKTYFAPPRDEISISPQPMRPYQPVYPPEQNTERRHSLLLERLSTERQIPTADIYQNNYQYTNQGFDDQQTEPQSEVLTVSNVKPSTITKNQQWYQQTKRENVTYNNVTPSSAAPSQQFRPQSQLEFQPQPQPQYQPPPQTLYQPPPQTQFQLPTQTYQPPPQTYQQQPYQPQPQVQSTYTENIAKDSYKSTTNNYTQNLYSNYPPKSTTWASNVDNQNSFLKTDSTDTYHKSTQQYSSSYVPPPWEQDTSYVSDTINQNYYQPPPLASTYNTGSDSTPGWKPSPPSAKFSKPTPTSYIPPAPNQSFVKPVINVEPPKLPGRKTYYSEYERRYISVPESTYIPTETKYQAQPDPSPKYYYDNNEPVETVEPQWRKELREFTEKTSQTTVQTETSVRPPWEEEPKFAKPEYAPTPTWSQTLKPRSWRERSFESEYIGSKEWPKTNTLGRGRPQSSYVNSGVDSPLPERTRGVSVDRYNPNSYQSPIPSEHPPVQSQTLNVQTKNYHNPTVPAYHARAAPENREQSASIQQQRQWGESRATPIQSRSFKYLQWITGTED